MGPGRGPRQRIAVLVVAAAITAGACGRPADAGVAKDTPSAVTATSLQRPALRHRQGRGFAYAAPAGWEAIEEERSIEIFAPDRVTAAAGFMALDMPGEASPEQFLRLSLEAAGIPNARIVSARPAPDWSWPAPQATWRGVDAEIEAAQDGRPIHMRITSHVLQGRGQYAGVIGGVQSLSREWDSVKDWLPRVRDSIRMTNGTGTTLPRRLPDDDLYARFNSIWVALEVPATDIAQARREGTMGYVRLIDPETDRVWELPLEAYDSSAGGYPNPEKPGALLQKAPS